MKNATFYLMNQHSISDGLTAVERLACSVVVSQWRKGKRVLIACENEAQTLRLDEALWARDLDAFVPHNLSCEGPRDGAPVEICQPQRRSNSPRDLLISLLPTYANFASTFNEVIDFVPDEVASKHLARDRYKAYRRLGFHLNMAFPPTY